MSYSRSPLTLTSKGELVDVLLHPCWHASIGFHDGDICGFFVLEGLQQAFYYSAIWMSGGSNRVFSVKAVSGGSLKGVLPSLNGGESAPEWIRKEASAVKQSLSQLTSRLDNLTRARFLLYSRDYGPFGAVKVIGRRCAIATIESHSGSAAPELCQGSAIASGSATGAEREWTAREWAKVFDDPELNGGFGLPHDRIERW